MQTLNFCRRSRNVGRPKSCVYQLVNGPAVRQLPGGLPFGSGSTSALVDGLVAHHAKRRHQVIVGLDASAFAAAPVGVGCLDDFLASAELAVKAGHQAQ